MFAVTDSEAFPAVPDVVVDGVVGDDPVRVKMNADPGRPFLGAVFSTAHALLVPENAAIVPSVSIDSRVYVPLCTPWANPVGADPATDGPTAANVAMHTISASSTLPADVLTVHSGTILSDLGVTQFADVVTPPLVPTARHQHLPFDLSARKEAQHPCECLAV